MHAPPMYSVGYSQLRGLFYVLGASIYAKLKNSKRILVTECGPTMYQNRFSPYDSITMTTHPFVMSKAKKLIQLFYNKEIDIITPFEDLTKAEVVALCPRPELFEFSHSCIGMRWIDSKWKKGSDGTCYGCVVRRLGLIVAGIKDTNYEKNPLIDEEGYSDHLSNLLAFSSEFLIDRENIEDYQLDNIDEFHKYDLFERFALDNISALHIIKLQTGELNPKIERFYEETIKIIGFKKIEERIREVRSKKYLPNFDKKVV